MFVLGEDERIPLELILQLKYACLYCFCFGSVCDSPRGGQRSVSWLRQDGSLPITLTVSCSALQSAEKKATRLHYQLLSFAVMGIFEPVCLPINEQKLTQTSAYFL